MLRHQAIGFVARQAKAGAHHADHILAGIPGIESLGDRRGDRAVIDDDVRRRRQRTDRQAPRSPRRAAPSLVVRLERGQGAAANLLVNLGQLARHDRQTVAAAERRPGRRAIQRGVPAPRRRRRSTVRPPPVPASDAAPLPFAAGSRETGIDRRPAPTPTAPPPPPMDREPVRPGCRRSRRRDQLGPRIADRRRSGIGDQRHVAPLAQDLQQRVGALRRRMGVIGHQSWMRVDRRAAGRACGGCPRRPRCRPLAAFPRPGGRGRRGFRAGWRRRTGFRPAWGKENAS